MGGEVVRGDGSDTRPTDPILPEKTRQKTIQGGDPHPRGPVRNPLGPSGEFEAVRTKLLCLSNDSRDMYVIKFFFLFLRVHNGPVTPFQFFLY